jgi:hypothetical protein
LRENVNEQNSMIVRINMEDKDELVMSPLCRNVTRDGVSAEIHIYRRIDDQNWILEVFDQENVSTVWVDKFATDQEALDMVLATIEKENTATFMRPPSGQLN